MCFVSFYYLAVCWGLAFSNGRLDTIVNKTYMSGDNVAVSCDIGFNADALNTTCNTSRLWDPQPTCTEVMCTISDVRNGYYRTSSDINKQYDNTTTCIGNTFPVHNSNNDNSTAVYTYNTTIFLECYCGFEASGPTVFTCLADGTWGKKTSTCVRIICNQTAYVGHEAVIMVPINLFVGEIGNATYNAEHFFLSVGDMDVESQLNKSLTWINKPTFGKCFYRLKGPILFA